MLAISVSLFALEFICINYLKNTNIRDINFDDEMLCQMMSAIKHTDINHYITYFFIYSTFAYLGIYYQTIMYIVISLQLLSLSMIAYMAFVVIKEA